MAPTTLPAGAALAAGLRTVGLAAGLDAIGITRAEPFTATRADIEARRDSGLSDSMAFTFRNPARSTSPQDLLRNARSIVVGALGYHRPEPPRPVDQPQGRVARYAWSDHYATLRAALQAVLDHLRADGHRGAVFLDGNHIVDREAARRAGLGWYGKNTNLLLGDAGSWFVLGSVVTDADLPADEPRADGCGPCRRCLDACPTGALPAPGVLDARRCLAWLAQKPGPFPRELRVALGDRIYGCDECQVACPPNRRLEHPVRLRPTRTVAPSTGPGVGTATATTTAVDVERAHRATDAWVPLLDLLAADDDEVLRRWGRWYLHDRRTFAPRRNALLALGNVADRGDGRVVAQLARSLRDPDPLLRASAVWAVRRLGLDELLVAVAGDADPEVQAELRAEVTPR